MRADGIRARQRERTRRVLLREGRRLFADHGYAAVSLARIVTAAGVTKGALHHHFAGKTELFHAVLTGVRDEVGRRVAAVADQHADPWDRLVAGCEEYLTATAEPDVRRIMLVDGPAALGWTAWRAMDRTASARHLHETVEELVRDGTIAARPAAPLVHLLSGAMNEAALWLASSGGPDDLADTRAALRRLIEALRTG